MICDDISTILGFSCHPLNDDGSVALIDTPFTFEDGDDLPVFVEKVGKSIRFFDDNEVVFHFLGRGLGDSIGGLRTRFIKTAIAPYGISLNDENVIEVWADQEHSKQAFARYMSGLLAVVGWEHDNQGVGIDSSYLVEEVALCLEAWKKGHKITSSPPFTGMSKTKYLLDFEVDGEAVIAIRPHPYSVGNALRKMVDIAGHDRSVKFRVVIDDRVDAEAAKTQGMILSSMATIMPMSRLIKASHASEAVN
ncbi:DUF1828 domain-containing protein [Pusillimonas sp. ANT_WB101]|uniref:DUF1828 domain-containing protein n=1 Tax=Pusillimonas sp. ANT_WB101 TaxID=2597356 RepID=UPI0011F07DD6|nr:DUF1828 domain-containing protein [Pusillimonas sp. ANT_WB101]KAA0910655.1 DUF1828 domain-containing protein [Pusillimonas sp. ANT_WB101]